MYRAFVQARSSAIRQTFTVGDRASGFGNFCWVTQRLMQLFDSVVSFATSLMRSNWSSGTGGGVVLPMSYSKKFRHTNGDLWCLIAPDF